MEHDEQRQRLLRSTASVALPTLACRLLGYVRDLLQAYFLGTGHNADAFTIAFTIPNLFRRLTGEGAMTSAFVPASTPILFNLAVIACAAFLARGSMEPALVFCVGVLAGAIVLGISLYFLFFWLLSPNDAKNLAAIVFHAARFRKRADPGPL
jgi:peptidoglycan biosynthesis protein MviN/MurJ (putative lipid II flippase)